MNDEAGVYGQPLAVAKQKHKLRKCNTAGQY